MDAIGKLGERTLEQGSNGGVVVDDNRSRKKESVIMMKQLLNKPLSAIGLAIILIIMLMVIFPSQLSSYNPNEIHLSQKLLPPSREHPFGTDNYGRDIFARVAYGSRLSIVISITAVGISLVIGVPLGIISGYYEKKTDLVLMRVMDVILAFPIFIFAMSLAASLGAGIAATIYATGIAGIPQYTRLVRAQTLSVKKNQYIEAATAAGASDFQIMFEHVLPNVLSPVIVLATLGMGNAILISAGLSFIGLGVKPPTPEWGIIISEGRDYLMQGYWWLAGFPGFAIMSTVLGFNLLGDGLRDILDPRLRR